MKKLLLLLMTCMFLYSCAPTNQACGSKGQHKKRKAKMGRMAPTMMNR